MSEYYRKWYDGNREVVVAVSCIFCGVVVPGNSGRLFCVACKHKWQRKVPVKVLYDIGKHPSFKKMPDELLIWKRIVDLRCSGVLKFRCRR